MLNPELRLQLSHETIAQRVQTLAQEIQTDYQNQEIVVMGLLKGAAFFMCDLLKQLDLTAEIGFLYLSSYQGAAQAQTSVQAFPLPLPELHHRHVLLVDEIYDTGASLAYAHQLCRRHQPASLKTCVLLIKAGHTHPQLPVIDYCGFTIPDVFVVGYGMDYQEKFRNLPDVMELRWE